ncbi:PQQ-dependent sugar dehydrogenase [Sabulicella glaciei]|uniref:PQQ-dependent sugar dehydrogenase n=1 Tax=Sabulicella glaciei TaxID=2984948 RepID=A0ABT3NZR5_9PROT|nr:PQQ-dependent sugar dehydrogenase [Roseococcus sp. MDT2-1-1]MCW8087069.1 PQQ-dependent sugar dehydrogenase [Roseococcus sp. MDT2-1-1]
MTMLRRSLPLLLAPALARAQDATAVRTGRGAVRVTEWASGLSHPWGAALLPDGGLLVTERPGRLRYVAPDGRVSAPLAGAPPVVAEGQGGLLDVAVPPDFARSREVFLSAATLVEGGALTRLWRARLGQAGLEALTPVLDAAPAQPSGRQHYGSRVLVSPDNAHLFMTTGDRNQDRERAQRPGDLAGKVLRLTRDGRVPADNPFVGRQGARGEVWSLGHRNPQGLAFNPATGSLILAEFGPRGGDELNLIQPGRNYGWPLVTTGREYWGGQIAGGRTAGPGFTDPIRFWTPAVSPSGIAFAPRDGFWRGDLFMACLNPSGLLRLPMQGDVPGEEERLLWNQVRMRQVVFAADGALLILTDENRGRILRVTPG